MRGRDLLVRRSPRSKDQCNGDAHDARGWARCDERRAGLRWTPVAAITRGELAVALLGAGGRCLWRAAGLVRDSRDVVAVALGYMEVGADEWPHRESARPPATRPAHVRTHDERYVPAAPEWPRQSGASFSAACRASVRGAGLSNSRARLAAISASGIRQPKALHHSSGGDHPRQGRRRAAGRTARRR